MNCKNNQILYSPKMEKLELWEKSFSHIFDLSEVADIILDREKKIFEIVFCDYPLIEIFLNKKFTTVIFHGENWKDLKITSENKEIDTIEKMRYIPRFKIMNEKTMLSGKGINTRNWIEIVFTNLSCNFYGAE